jgi:hypothetical protein
MSCLVFIKRFPFIVLPLVVFLSGCGGGSDRADITVASFDCPSAEPALTPDASAEAPSDAGASADGATSPDSDASAPDAAVTSVDATPEAGPSCTSCPVALANPPSEGAGHVGECEPVSYVSKPPSSGNHYPVWPVFRVYEKPVPWGFLVHGLEHGAIVIVYNCPDGCPNDVVAIRALWAATSTKPGCGRPPVIVAPDPTLDVRFAATAWGHTLRAPCFDRAAFASFIMDHADQGPESIPSDCGVLDREATGWCQ